MSFSAGGVFFVLYIGFVIGVGLYVLSLLSRFVGAHRRIAAALERIAENNARESR